MVATPSSLVVRNTVDRRRAHRARLSARVTTTVGNVLLDAACLDVSTGGLRLLAAHQPVVGAPVSVVFFVNGDIVSARGTVRWCARTPRGLYSFGVAFSSIEDDGALVVASYCRASVS